MSIVPSFDTGALRIRLKTAEDKVKAFESGEKYVQMQEQFKAVFREQNARIRKLERELGKAHAQTVTVRKILMMFTEKQMQGNLPCAKRLHTLANRVDKSNATEVVEKMQLSVNSIHSLLRRRTELKRK